MCVWQEEHVEAKVVVLGDSGVGKTCLVLRCDSLQFRMRPGAAASPAHHVSVLHLYPSCGRGIGMTPLVSRPHTLGRRFVEGRFAQHGASTIGASFVSLRPPLGKRCERGALFVQSSHDLPHWTRLCSAVHTYIRSTYIYAYIPAHTYVHTHTHTHTHTHACMHKYIRVYIHTYMHTYTYIRTYVHTYIRTYMHGCKHTYLRMYDTHKYVYIHACM